MDTQPVPIVPGSLSTAQFDALSAIPPETEWFANLRNRPTRDNYKRDIQQFIAFAGLGSSEQLRQVTRPHVIARRDHLQSRGLANDTIRRKLAALSSLYDYLCNRHSARDRRAAPHHRLPGRSKARGVDGRAAVPAGEEQRGQNPGQAPA